MYFDDVYIINKLAKKVNEAKETNDFKKQKKLKGFSRLLSTFNNIYYIMKDYEDCEEFEDFHTFYSYITQIFCNYLKNYIEGEKIDLERIKSILDSTVYKYSFFGFTINERGKTYLLLGKCVLENEEYETLKIPIPITKTDEWYSDLRNNNL